jgi:hypothetical protein
MLIAVETNKPVYGFLLRVIAALGLLKGKAIVLDARTFEANAAIGNIVRLETGDNCEELLTAFVKASGVERLVRVCPTYTDAKKRMTN